MNNEAVAGCRAGAIKLWHFFYENNIEAIQHLLLIVLGTTWTQFLCDQLDQLWQCKSLEHDWINATLSQWLSIYTIPDNTANTHIDTRKKTANAL